MGYKLTLRTGRVTEAKRVTEVIRAGMPRPALQAWELREAVAWALSHPGTGVETALTDWRRDHARHTERGTAVHRWIQATLRGEPTGPLMATQGGYKIAFTNWLADTSPDLDGALVEQTLCTADATIAGTADLIVNGAVYDWKTSEKKGNGKPWPDQVAQLGAYASMDYLVDDEHVGRMLPLINEAAVVHLYADGTYAVDKLDHFDLGRARALWAAVRTVAEANPAK